MRFVSTRNQAPPLTFSDAILDGLAPDGGLYVPERWPQLADPKDGAWEALDYPAFADRLLRPFLDGDPLADRLSTLCRNAFNFDVPLTYLGTDTALLELFHGPTAAFKDFGARFLAGSFEALREIGFATEPLRVLVATSGDTGAAVAAACHRRSGIEVGVLFPADGVAPRQKQQLTCWDDNVGSFAVLGTFDACQRMTKELFAAGDWPIGARLTSANSINIGRLLPQVVYAAWAATRYRADRGVEPGLVIPSGNVGDAVAAFWALRLGFPIRGIAIATNANRVVPDWFETGRWEPRSSTRTLANAMDVGNPSNMERLFHLFPNPTELRDGTPAAAVDDSTIRATIRRSVEQWGVAVCPHTATGIHLRESLDSPDWIVYATAHPAKFDDIVEPLVGRKVPVPASLEALLARQTRVVEVDADVDALKEAWG